MEDAAAEVGGRAQRRPNGGRKVGGGQNGKSAGRVVGETELEYSAGRDGGGGQDGGYERVLRDGDGLSQHGVRTGQKGGGIVVGKRETQNVVANGIQRQRQGVEIVYGLQRIKEALVQRENGRQAVGAGEGGLDPGGGIHKGAGQFAGRIELLHGDIDIAQGIHRHATGIEQAAGEGGDAAGGGRPFFHGTIAKVGDIDVAGTIHGEGGRLIQVGSFVLHTLGLERQATR